MNSLTTRCLRLGLIAYTKIRLVILGRPRLQYLLGRSLHEFQPSACISFIYDDVGQLGFIQPGDTTPIGGYQSRHLLKPMHLFQ